jgi:hypothetical protein
VPFVGGHTSINQSQSSIFLADYFSSSMVVNGRASSENCEIIWSEPVSMPPV